MRNRKQNRGRKQKQKQDQNQKQKQKQNQKQKQRTETENRNRNRRTQNRYMKQIYYNTYYDGPRGSSIDVKCTKCIEKCVFRNVCNLLIIKIKYTMYVTVGM